MKKVLIRNGVVNPRHPDKVIKYRIDKNGDYYLIIFGRGTRIGNREAWLDFTRAMRQKKTGITFIRENAYASLAQEGLFHEKLKRGEISAKTVAEFDRATKGKHLPYKVRKRNPNIHDYYIIQHVVGGLWHDYEQKYYKEDAIYKFENLVKRTRDTKERWRIFYKGKVIRDSITKRNPTSEKAYTLAVHNKKGDVSKVYVLDWNTHKKLAEYKTIESAQRFADRKGIRLEVNPNPKRMSNPKKIKTVRSKHTTGMVIAEYSAKEQKDNGGYTHGVFLKDEWAQPAGYRYSDMDFDSLEQAEEWAKHYDD